MDYVAVDQLIFSGTSTEASFLSSFPAHLIDTFWLCNDFANRDQKSLFATFQSHSSISSIKSVNELQCHSVNVRANSSGDMRESWVVGEVLFLLCAYPTVEISGEYMIVLTMKVLWGVRGGSVEIIIEGSV